MSFIFLQIFEFLLRGSLGGARSVEASHKNFFSMLSQHVQEKLLKVLTVQPKNNILDSGV